MPRPRRRLQPPTPLKPDLTPLIDVTFLILVFFLFTIRFRALEGLLRTHLPSDVGPARPSVELQERARVIVRGPDELAPLERRLVTYQVGPHRTASLREVGERLTLLRRLDPDLEVVVDARAGTTYADVVGVVDTANGVGCRAITFSAAR